MTDDPKWYLHEPFMLGANVPDGREGRRYIDGQWWRASVCREWPAAIHETRPVPERMVAIELPESVVREYAGIVTSLPLAVACRAAVDRLDGGS